MVKQDLAEFGSIMQCDGSRVANVVREKFNQETAATASKKMKQGMTSLWGELSKALVIPPDDDECCEIIKITNGKPITLDRVKAQLFALQSDVNTYTEDLGPKDNKFQPWVERNFDLEQVKPEISELLVSNSNVRSLYTQLVPLTVSNVDFWCRYFYKKHLLEEEENRRIALVRRAEEVDEKELTWDEDEDATQKELSVTHAMIEEPNACKQIQPMDVPDMIQVENPSASGSQKSFEISTLGKEIFKNTDCLSKEDICSNSESSAKNEIKLEEPSPGFLTPPSKRDSANSSGNTSACDSAEETESPTDDWERVCDNEAERPKTPSENVITQSNDWEEW